MELRELNTKQLLFLSVGMLVGYIALSRLLKK